MKIMAWILLVLVVVIPAIVGSYSGWNENRQGSKSHSINKDPICQKKAMGFSICDIAEGQAQNLSKQLPYSVDSNSTITSVVSNLNVVSLTVITEFSQEEIQRELGSDLPEAINTFTTSQTEIATKSVCNGDKRNRAFIEGGGVMEYQMKYKNTQPLTIYRVESCPAI